MAQSYKFLVVFNRVRTTFSIAKNCSFSTWLNEQHNTETFKDAVCTLNSLQVKPNECTQLNNVNETFTYLKRSGITLHQLEKLSAIHVAGTKGKGSTCAICESILRSFGCRTGFFNSPHLVSVTERYLIDGQPISEKYFTKMFWKLYNRLESYREHAADMPSYFKFLTILSFHIFLDSNVDVAIFETGIGGLCDCTNVVRNAKTIGITSLRLDHANILGRSIDQIAYHKAGIIKHHSNVFTVPLPEKGFSVIEEVSNEKNANLFVVPEITEYKFKKFPKKLRTGNRAQNLNASLAIQLAYDWLRRNQSYRELSSFDPGIISDTNREVCKGIETCDWPGMCQMQILGNKRIHMDGAQSLAGLKSCIEWFRKSTEFNNNHRCLIFNAPSKDARNFLTTIANHIEFQIALFVPDIHFYSNDRCLDYERVSTSGMEQIYLAESNAQFWMHITHAPSSIVKDFTSILDAFLYLDKNYSDVEMEILVTGSMSVIGATRLALKRYQILTN